MNFSDLTDWAQSLANAGFATALIYFGVRIKDLTYASEKSRGILSDLDYRLGKLERRSE